MKVDSHVTFLLSISELKLQVKSEYSKLIHFITHSVVAPGLAGPCAKEMEEFRGKNLTWELENVYCFFANWTW